MRAILLADDLVFRRGDEACFHRNAGPGGRSDCASRFRLERTHSLLLMQHLGRNLIMVFSTVNTLREKSPCAPQSRASAERDACRSHAPAAMMRRSPSARPAQSETSFFKRFFRAPKRAPNSEYGCRPAQADATRQVNGRNPAFVRLDGFSRRTSRIARKCAKFERRSGVSKRCARRPRRAVERRSERIAARIGRRTNASHRQRKSRPRRTRTASTGDGIGRADSTIRISDRLLPAARRSRQGPGVR
jgi:hypothetical protein